MISWVLANDIIFDAIISFKNLSDVVFADSLTLLLFSLIIVSLNQSFAKNLFDFSNVLIRQ